MKQTAREFSGSREDESEMRFIEGHKHIMEMKQWSF